MTAEDLEREIREGGRFVCFRYCFSIVIMTFLRSTSVRFLKRTDDGAGVAFGYSLLSGGLGWWGIPWGPINTVRALITNFRGGQDVTSEVMTQIVGPGRAAALIASRRAAPAGLGMMLFRASILAPPILAVPLIAMAINSAQKSEEVLKAEPGYAAFQTADDLLDGTASGGNTPEAAEAAKVLSGFIKGMLEESVDGDESFHCPIWCQAGAERWTVLMRVSDLSKFNQESQDTLARSLWQSSQALLLEQGHAKPGMELVCGLRGFATYDSVLAGRWSPDGGESEPEEILGFSGTKERLVQAFSPEDVPPGPNPTGP